MKSKMDAWGELAKALRPGERVEGVMFGGWGWSEYPSKKLARFESNPPSVPFEKRGVPLGAEEAEQYMHGWSFDGGFGAPTTYATYIWTTERIFWVEEYDGATWLASVPRNPTACWPKLSGSTEHDGK